MVKSAQPQDKNRVRNWCWELAPGSQNAEGATGDRFWRKGYEVLEGTGSPTGLRVRNKIAGCWAGLAWLVQFHLLNHEGELGKTGQRPIQQFGSSLMAGLIDILTSFAAKKIMAATERIAGNAKTTTKSNLHSRRQETSYVHRSNQF